MNLTVKQAAERLGISRALMYELCAQKQIRHERHGLGRGVIRIPEAALDDYQKSREVQEGSMEIQTPLKHIKV